MIKIGVMGLGNIALKAYVPPMNELRGEVDWHFYSRDEAKIQKLARENAWHHTFSDYEVFLASGIKACFVHTPTPTHGKIIKELLERGIHVFVDKPVSENFEEVVALHQLAKAKGLILMVGFNRRYAPMNQRLKEIPEKNLILAQKNRQVTKGQVKYELFDMMIHVVDTVLYLLDKPVLGADFQVVADAGGVLQRSMITFRTENTTAIASTNMEAGAHTETVEVQSPAGTYSVADLNVLVKNELGTLTQETFGDWENTLTKRGFKQMIESFVAQLQKGSTSSLTTPESSITSHEYVNHLYQSYLNQK